MAKKTSMVMKRQWLNEYDKGKPQIDIATKYKRDVRTIKKGIADARRERDISLAHAELLKETLQKHNTGLINLVEKLVVVLQPLPASQAIPWGETDIGLLTFPGGRARYQNWPDPEVSEVTLDIEAEAQWQLLMEHLKRDPLSRALQVWKRTLSSHIEERVNLKQKLAELLQNKTGYEFRDGAVGDHCLFLPAVDHLSHYLLMSLPLPFDIAGMEESISADSDTGQVKYGQGTTLAFALGEEENCRTNIIAALKELSTTQIKNTLMRSYEAHIASTTKTRRAAEEICMMGLIPGQCRICRRLGM
ncbi:MAG: hypothetical protein J7L19_03075 [Dehalococcoidia bacterium]|nr:hypothetical protein [Dehalococcoidia bacterium]